MKGQATCKKGSGRGRRIFIRNLVVFCFSSIHLCRRDNDLSLFLIWLVKKRTKINALSLLTIHVMFTLWQHHHTQIS